MPGIQQIGCLCENGPFFSSSEHSQLICGSLAQNIFKSESFLAFGEGHDKYQTSGADGVKTAVLRKGRASLVIIWAAAHRR